MKVISVDSGKVSLSAKHIRQTDGEEMERERGREGERGGGREREGGERGRERGGERERERGRGREEGSKVPIEEAPLYSVNSGTVRRIETYGVFVELNGYHGLGLVHVSQISSHRVEHPEDVLAIGERVYCKVIEVKEEKEKEGEGEGERGRGRGRKRVSLSVKLVDQSSG